MANNFIRDPYCKALWRLEPGTLLVDSIGTNTLTASASSPTEDTTYFKEGTGSAAFNSANSQYFKRNDSDLSAGFPLKSGDTTKQITAACWVWFTSTPDSYVWSKMDISGNQRTLGLNITTNKLTVVWATSLTTSISLNTNWTPSTGQWYHITVVADGVAETCQIIVYDPATSTFTPYSFSSNGALAIGTAPFMIGARWNSGSPLYPLNGKVDELVVFNRLLSNNEVYDIAKGIFTKGNNFKTVPDCKALWRLEPGALTVDSISTNTLSNTSVLEDTTNFREGTGAALFDASAARYLEISDANLSADFPLKNGDTVKRGTWCFWFRPTSTGGYQDLVAKFDWDASKRSLATYLNGTSFYVQWGTGATYQEFSCGTVANNKWYHVGISFDGVGKVLQVYVYNATDGTVTYSSVLYPTNSIGVYDCEFAIGRVYPNTTNRFVGQIDEVAVFNRFLQTREIDTIRNARFPLSNCTTDFSTYTTGQAPTDWTERWNVGTGSLNIADTGEIGGKCLQAVGGTDRYAASWDAPGTPADVEMLAKIKANGTGDDTWRLILRGGYNTNIVGYMAYGRHSSSQVRIGYYNNSTTFVELGTISITLTGDVYYWVRFRVIGTSIKCKVWAVGDTEPSSWGLDTTDSTISGSGWVMVGEYWSSVTATLDWLAVAVNGATASFPETGNFYNDPCCKARLRFENGAFINDSQGKNALTAVNAPTVDTSNFKEGAASAALARSSLQYFTIPDVDLSNNFPFKSTGNNQVGTYCCWVRFNTGGTINQGIMGKLRVPGSCGMFFYNNLFYLEWNNGWQSTSIAATTGEWYHVTCRMDGPNIYSDITVYRASDQQSFFYSKGDWGALPLCYAGFCVGSFNDPSVNCLDGNIDEALVFNRLLTNDEIGAVREGTFGGASVPLNDYWHNGLPFPLLGTNEGDELTWHNGLPLKPLVSAEAATSNLAATLAPVTSSITGNIDPAGQLAASLAKITASGSGTSYGTTKAGKVAYQIVYNVLNELRAGKVGYTVVYTAESEAEPVTGDLAAAIQAITADIDSYAISNIGSLDATLQNLTANIDAEYTIPNLGVLNAVLAPITASGSGVHFSLPDTFDLTLEVSRRVRYYIKT
jgi:hypothetical protein